MFSIDQSRLIAKSQAHIDNIATVADKVLLNLEQLSSLNIKSIRAAVEQSAASSQLILEHQETDTPINLQAELVQPFSSLFVTYIRSIYEIGTQNRQDMTSSLEAQMAEFNKSIARGFEQTNGGTAGSESAVSALKAAVAAFNSAYENMSAAGKLAADIIDANANAVTDSIVESGLAHLEPLDASESKSRTAGKTRSRKSQNEAAQTE